MIVGQSSPKADMARTTPESVTGLDRHAVDPDDRGAISRWTSATDTWLLACRHTHSVREVRDAFVSLAYELHRDGPQAQAVCVLAQSRLSASRLERELARLRSVLRPDLEARLHWLRPTGRGWTGSLADVPAALMPRLRELIDAGQRERPVLGLPPRAIVDLALVTDSLAGARSRSRLIREWQEICGVSYPTVSSAIDEMARRQWIERSGARGVRLRSLLADEVISAARALVTRRQVRLFRDPTGLSSPRQLAEQLRRRQADGTITTGIRIGGVIGASHYFPWLDITGAPRLDVSVDHVSWAPRSMDGALAPMADHVAASGAVLAVHGGVDVMTPLGLVEPDELRWASPLECLADLLELGYQAEAAETARYLADQAHRPV